ncbi:hypothetical protein NE237_019715 [Protea cynaroides]|uniref:Uncharacterized protein n=1 Tax=Protea cynaroides TaxID=273540 RepID=A0A9Q0H5W2_9MAGN|nr:hypothetical protein NE237_019715 [Protea cynaroides]
MFSVAKYQVISLPKSRDFFLPPISLDVRHEEQLLIVHLQLINLQRRSSATHQSSTTIIYNSYLFNELQPLLYLRVSEWTYHGEGSSSSTLYRDNIVERDAGGTTDDDAAQILVTLKEKLVRRLKKSKPIRLCVNRCLKKFSVQTLMGEFGFMGVELNQDKYLVRKQSRSRSKM